MAEEMAALLEKISAISAAFENVTKSNICAVSVKLPVFWPANPSLWFRQIDAQFSIANINKDSTKLNHLISVLDCSLLTVVADVLDDPNVTYERLKQVIIKRCSVSDEQRIRKLLSQLELGDKKPSQLLREIKALANSTTSTDIIKQLWMQRLPTSTQAILQVSAEPLDILSEMADRIADVTQPSVMSSSTSHPSDVLDSLIADIAEIKSTFRNFYQRRSPVRHRSPSRSLKVSKFCWYHETFGKDAQRCRSPCSFKMSGN